MNQKEKPGDNDISENVRKRWLNECLPALQERINAGSKAKQEATMTDKFAIVLLKDSTKSRAYWKIGRIIDQIVGKEGVTGGYKILTGNRYVVERPLLLVCDFETGGERESNSADGVSRD